MRRSLSTLAITAALLVPVLGGCGSPESDQEPSRKQEQASPIRNVVFIVVDTLRRDHLGAYGYARNTSPAIDALAAEGVRFDRAYATSGWTVPSVTSMLTGLYPSGHGVVRPHTALAVEIPTLAGTLRERGYATAGVVSHRVIGRRWGLHRGFEWFDESHVKGHAGVSTDGVTDTAISMLDRLSAGDAPFFLFVHYFDPHYAYQRHDIPGFSPEPAGRLHGGERMAELRGLSGGMTTEELAFLRALYDGEIRYTDGGIGRLLDRLKSQGRYEDTLILFSADHGEEFLERGWLGHTRTLYDELVRVPLIMRLPQRGARAVIEDPVSLTSLAPTIMELLGFEIPGYFPNPSLAPQLREASVNATDGTKNTDSPPSRVITEVDFVPVSVFERKKTVKQVSIIGPRFKLIRNLLAETIELYDLQSDPKEQINLAATDPERVRELSGQLDAMLLEIQSRRVEGRELELSDREIEELRQLGYGD